MRERRNWVLTRRRRVVSAPSSSASSSSAHIHRPTFLLSSSSSLPLLLLLPPHFSILCSELVLSSQFHIDYDFSLNVQVKSVCINCHIINNRYLHFISLIQPGGRPVPGALRLPLQEVEEKRSCFESAFHFKQSCCPRSLLALLIRVSIPTAIKFKNSSVLNELAIPPTICNQFTHFQFSFHLFFLFRFVSKNEHLHSDEGRTKKATTKQANNNNSVNQQRATTTEDDWRRSANAAAEQMPQSISLPACLKFEI